jgi:hypothetical protein
MMNDNDSRQPFPLSESVQEEQVVDAVFDATAGVADDKGLCWLELEISRRNLNGVLGFFSPSVWMLRNRSTGTRMSMHETVRLVRNFEFAWWMTW